MAKIPSFKRLNKTDYSEEFRPLVEALAVSLNIGVETLYSALNRQLTFKDNIKSTTKDVEVTVNASGIPKVETTFALDISGQIEGLSVIRYENLTNSTTFATSGINISYTQSNNFITVNHITGLPANNRFRLRILAIGS